MSQATVLVVEDDIGLREAIADTLEMAGYIALAVEDGESALVELGRNQPDIVVSDVNMPGMDGHTLLKSIRHQNAKLPVLMMTAYGTVSSAVQAMHQGATDYLAKPFKPEKLIGLIKQYVVANEPVVEGPVVADPASQSLLKLAQRVARSDATVMISGPSGTGKEVLARYVHQCSERETEPFIAINCAAIPDNMLEATLFGYEKGAFTGALQATPGKFELAQGGTLFLDEIGEMDLNLQVKLLRVLQEREVERIGGRKTLQLDVRVIAATNRDLKRQVSEGNFREDLFYRLNVFPLEWKALSERPLDILPIARHLLNKHAIKMGRPVPELSESAAQRIAAYRWPGNVRELENTIQRALILQEGNDILADDLHMEMFNDMTDPEIGMPGISASNASRGEDVVSSGGLEGHVRSHEYQLILDALRECRGSRKAVAEKLNLSPRTLRYKLARMREEGIDIPDTRSFSYA
ncbi:MAG: sigma-54-dependent Fis family transcriptional regulator [Kangiellaceae bacterium]|nr:sigma-54-dependent Fis family transcriptional regulator [Kangiellaceae bacterium]|tara:strand:- start:9457 stop:10854 length:1398 start_codon:yes stop_codon:yes gene_type:complete